MNHQKITHAHVAASKRSTCVSIVWLASALFAVLTLQACTGVNTFPMTARAGDTVSVMVGGSEQARKTTIAVSLQDSLGQTWDLQALGLVRSVFNLRMDGRAVGQHYSSYLDSDSSWLVGRHEPVQTVLVADLPTNVSPGTATMTIALNVGDNSAGIADPFTVNLDIVPGSGTSDQFLRQDAGYESGRAAQLGKLEPAPHAKITLGTATIGAASLKISFNSATLNGNDINVYVPESTVRGSSGTGAFGATQRMVYWRQDGQNLYIDMVAPQGIAGKYLQFFVIHPKDSSIQPNFTLTEVAAYDVDGNAISVQPTLEYFP